MEQKYKGWKCSQQLMKFMEWTIAKYGTIFGTIISLSQRRFIDVLRNVIAAAGEAQDIVF